MLFQKKGHQISESADQLLWLSPPAPTYTSSPQLDSIMFLSDYVP